MVRLKSAITLDTRYNIILFQFLNGAIKIKSSQPITQHLRYFNSSMVRLKFERGFDTHLHNKFQFLNGAIKIKNPA